MRLIDELLHGLARALLRVVTPLQAHAVLRGLGRILPKRRGLEEIRRAAKRLGSRGTCLSRAMALSARAPDADVVIGVFPPQQRRGALAHAWIEYRGLALDAEDVAGVEIARMPVCRASRRRRCCAKDRGAW
ncbi:MAG: hypothetical protein ABTD50_14210 [Polyangiaceae bacterium]